MLLERDLKHTPSGKLGPLWLLLDIPMLTSLCILAWNQTFFLGFILPHGCPGASCLGPTPSHRPALWVAVSHRHPALPLGRRGPPNDTLIPLCLLPSPRHSPSDTCSLVSQQATTMADIPKASTFYGNN